MEVFYYVAKNSRQEEIVLSAHQVNDKGEVKVTSIYFSFEEAKNIANSIQKELDESN